MTTATTEIYTLSLHDALPISVARHQIAPRLGDADDRLARLKLLQRDAVVRVALEIERGHVDIVGIVEPGARAKLGRSEEHTSELQSRQYLVCRLLLEKKKTRT